MKPRIEQLYRYAKQALPLIAVAMLAGCSGCSLNKQIPKASIEFENTATGQKVAIHSHKDVELKDVRVVFDTNGCPTITIGYYAAKSNIEVVKAAIQAQQQQIAGLQVGLEKIVGAAVGSAVPGK